MRALDTISRRDMVLASGLFVAGLRQSPLRGQETEPTSEEKDLIFRTMDPRNAEPALNKLIGSWITPTKHFYVRSHAENPQIDPQAFRLTVEGLVDRPLVLSLDDIRQMGEQTITATLTCAGNRRAEFNKEGKVGGVQWGAGAIGNATWTGVPLAKVLEKAGVKQEAKHIWFEGLDEITKGGTTIGFGASIPIDKAMLGAQENTSEVGALLAYAMNGAPLAPDHGAPLRTVVPGYIGARSVKWLGKLVVSDRTSPNHYLATAYKLVKKTDSIDWEEAGPIYRYLINAAIGSTDTAEILKPGKLEIAGYVLPSGILGCRVSRVAISCDGGKSWTQAELTGKDQDYCWQLWKAKVQITDKTKEIVVRAQDSSGGFMPARVPWNAKGYLQNSWFRLPVRVSAS